MHSKGVGAIDVDKAGYVSRDDDTDDADGQGSERKGSDSDAYEPGEDDADGLGSERKGSDADDAESERLLQEYRAIAGVEAPGPASEINPEKMAADDTQELRDLRLQPRRYPARALQKPRYKEASSSVNSKDVDNTGTLYRTVISLSPMPFRSTHVTSP